MVCLAWLVWFCLVWCVVAARLVGVFGCVFVVLFVVMRCGVLLPVVGCGWWWFCVVDCW